MVLTDLFPDYGRPGCRTGNVLISGLAAMGAEGCWEQLLCGILAEGKPVFCFYSQLAPDRREALEAAARSQGCRVWAAGERECRGVSLDLFRLFPTAEEQAEALYAFLREKGDSPETARILCRYWRDSILSQEAEGERPTARETLTRTVEQVQAGIRTSRRLSRWEREEEGAFLESREVYRCWGLASDRFRRLDACGIWERLSGEEDPWEALAGPLLFLVWGPLGARDTGRVLPGLTQGFLHVAAALWAERREGLHVWIRDSSRLDTEAYEALLELGAAASQALPVCVYDPGAAAAQKAHGPGIWDYFGAFCLFQTHDGPFWSDFLGTAFLPDRTESYTRRRGLLSLPAGGVVPRKRFRYEGISLHRVEKPLYEPREFLALREKALIFYNVYANRKTRKQLEW